jgi:glycerol dehydrogenase
LEATVEATVLMSGLGFENGGLSLAHSLTRGLVKARDAKNAIHGAHVAWGLLVQLAAEGRDDGFIGDLRDFYGRTGLPRTLAELGMDRPSADEIDEIARWTMTAPHLTNLGVPLTQDMVADAIRRMERFRA